MIAEGRLCFMRCTIKAVLVFLLSDSDFFVDNMLVKIGTDHCNPHDSANVQPPEILINCLAFIGRSVLLTGSL